MTESAPKPFAILESVKGLLLWVGGSLAGITALLYTCGYLVARAHFSMLGLHGLVQVDNDYFLQEGAKFVIAAGYDVLRTLLVLAAVAGLLAFVAMSVRRALDATKLGVLLGRWRARVASHADWWRYPAFAALFIGLVLHSDHYLAAFVRPLAVANLLYADPAQAAARLEADGSIAGWILSGASEELARTFEDLLLGAVVAAVLAMLASRMVAVWRVRGWLITPFFAALSIYLVTLPMAYGVLQRPVRYPMVSLQADSDPVVAEGRLFLLSRADGAFIVWDARARRVVWVPSGSVKRAEIRGVEDLFSSTAPGASGVTK